MHGRRQNAGKLDGNTKILLGTVIFFALLTYAVLGPGGPLHNNDEISRMHIMHPGHAAHAPVAPPVKILTKGGTELEVDTSAMESVFVGNLKVAIWTEDGPQPMFVIGVDATPPFMMAMPDIDKEGVGKDLHRNAIIEAPTTRFFQFILQERCALSPELVVDLGANFGYFSTYSAVMGCRVISLEAQPRLGAITNATFHLNNVQKRVKWHNHIVHFDPDAKLRIHYNLGTCWACSYVEIPRGPPGPDSVDVSAVRVDSIVKEDVLLLKIDVEGFEVNALESAEGLLTKYNVENIVIEWNPGMNTNAKTTKAKATEWLHKLDDMGYVLRHYDLRMQYPKDGLKEESFPILGKTWVIPREKMEDFDDFTFKGNREANIWLQKRQPR
eukprot:TRINITY_DN18419_c0_g1_i1.p1 TRINITY_DN18419_c0_g1~~TRINITY_DN18419_c0_g1_i1.p1  ORF type:complete len:384 (+),score=107.38 TRINITY_DN18419_c0_g1_i1:167-1318(+)